MSCGVDHRHGFDVILLWPWCRLAGANSNLTRSLGISICWKKKKKKRERERVKFSDFQLKIISRQVENLTVSMRIWVQSLASLSGLRIQHCCKLQRRSTDAARILLCCGCGAVWQLWLRFSP